MLTKEQFENNFKALSKHLSQLGTEALYLTGADCYLSEYTDKNDSLRTYLTPFSGSTAEVLFVPSKKIYLLVDGRYHLQADLECKGYDYIEVVKISSQASLFQELLNLAGELSFTQIACVAERTSLAAFEKFKSLSFKVQDIDTASVEKIIGLKYQPANSPIHLVPEKVLPAATEQKFKKLNLPLKQGIYLSSCDDIAWLSHCRSYQIPCNSYFYSKALVTSDHIYIFIPLNSELLPEAKQIPEITFYPISLDKLEEKLRELCLKNGITHIVFDPSTVTMKDFMIIEAIFEPDVIHKRVNPVTQHKIYKTSSELKEFERCFLLSSHAISETIRSAKRKVKEKTPISEIDLADTVWSEYQKQGAKGLSFNTISAVAENTAIIHYGACSKDRMLQPGQMVLLDSGAYYQSGFATDCTRSFIPELASLSEEKIAQWKKIYTLVLRSQIQAEMAIFKAGTLGNAIDQLARGVLLAQGLDFQHGLGHGVGIRVHDPGAGRLSAYSKEELHPGVVCSIEPGYYVNGEFGIRLENVVYVAHSDFPNLLKFKPLIYVAWEEELIDWNALSVEETTYLKNYQNICKKLGTQTSI